MTDARYSKLPTGNEEQTTVQFKTQAPPPKNTRKILLSVASVIVVLAVIVTIIVLVLLAKSEGGTVREKNMACACDNDVCTQIGGDVLAAGGGGVDATIAILLCLGAVQPQSNGIGGGGFMLVHTKEEDKVINFREKAPAAASRDMFVGDNDWSVNGGLASGVPGEIRGYWVAHQRYGRLEWKDLFTPSVEILRSGITVTPHMEKSLKSAKANMIKDENLTKMFFKNSSDVESYIRAGEVFTNDKLAAAYERIGDEGPDAFYTGEMAENIVNATSARGGIMTLQDLQDYEARLDEPFRFEYRDRKLISAPPPASGHVVALVLQLLNNFQISSFAPTQAWNYIIEAFRFGYAMRSQTGDSSFSDKTTWVVDKIRNHSWADDVLSKDFKEINGIVKPYTNIHKYSNEIYATYDGTHTTHVSVIGPDGEAVSCTSTVNLYFGSRVMTNDGIVMNNEMDDFSTPGVENSFGYQPSPENFIVPGKRPMSSSSPTIVFDAQGEANFVTGAAGGSRIITGALLSLINALDFGMTLEENMNATRIHDQLTQKTYYETWLDTDMKEALGNLGYNMTLRAGYMSVVTSVSNLRGVTEASGDPRKSGTGRVVKQKGT